MALPQVPADALNRVATPSGDVQSVATAASAPVKIVYGRARLGADLFAVGTIGADLVLGCGWCVGEIDAIESVTINGQAPPAGVTLTHYTGLASQTADATLVAAISGYTDTLVATVSGQTVALAYTVVRIPASAVTSWPRVEAIIRGKKILDTRTALTAYSTNPALVLRDFIAAAAYGQGLAVDAASVNAVADACDALLVDGFKRREINIVIDRVSPTAQWVDVLRTYSGCFVVRDGNTVRLVPNRPASSVATLTASDIIAGSMRLKKRSGRRAPTVVRVQYISTTATPWKESDAIAEASGVAAGTTPRREEVVALPGIQRYAQAYREAVERLNASRLTDLDAEWGVFDAGLKYQAGDVVTVTHPIGLTAKLFRITDVEHTAPGRWKISATEYDSNVYSDATNTSPVADSDLPSPATISAPTGLAAASGTAHLLKLADGSIITRMLATFTPPTNIFYHHAEVQFQKSGDTQWAGATDVPAGQGAAYCSPVEDGATYAIRVRSINSFGVASDWVSINHVVIGKTEPPGVPQQFFITRDPDGTRRFTWLPPSPNPVDLDGYQLRYQLGAGHTWATMTALHQGLQTSSPWETNQLAKGTYTFAIVAVDTSGNISNAVYIEATIDDPRLAGVLESAAPHLTGWPGTKVNCWVDPITGWIVATDSKTWANFTTDGVTWATWTAWARLPNTLTYTHTIIDVGVVTKFTPLLSAEYIGAATLEVRTSLDNITWTAYAAPAGQVTARYMQARVTISGAGAACKTMSIILDASMVVDDLNDITMSALTGVYRIGVGDIRLPITKTYGVIKSVSIALQNVGAGWSWEIIDKATSPGPRIKIYNTSNVLADAIIDATVRGV